MGYDRDRLVVLEEPRLEFRYGQSTPDPHDGLALFGPYDADMPSHPKGVSYGAIGTDAGLHHLGLWVRSLRRPILPEPSQNARLWPLYPGFDVAFDCALPERATSSHCLNESELLASTSIGDANERAAAVVQHYLDGIERIVRRDDPVSLIYCIVPDVVYRNCRPLSYVRDTSGTMAPANIRRARRRGQMDLFSEQNPEIYQFSVDFRRQVKARSMKYGVPIQIIKESTIRNDSSRERSLTPASDRAWNLSVASFYKAGGKPWRLTSAREGVSYIGMAYRRSDPSTSSRSACCAAQMFLDTGDGIVFMGEFGPWYSPQDKEFHLSPQSAKDLLQGVLGTYRALDGRALNEVLLHCRSFITEEEFEGFRAACPSGVRLVAVRVREERSAVRLFREGKYPVLRGTWWQMAERAGYLWANGFKERVATYDGWETPVPLRIDVLHGDADVNQVAVDILGLTKLNYNACRLGDNEPVTVGFSDAVGEILVSNPTVTERSPKFKFYI